MKGQVKSFWLNALVILATVTLALGLLGAVVGGAAVAYAVVKSDDAAAQVKHVAEAGLEDYTRDKVLDAKDKATCFELGGTWYFGEPGNVGARSSAPGWCEAGWK
jgi:hypothetical protein